MRAGKLEILEEGRLAKLVVAVDQITLSGEQARQRGTRITVVTERGVLEQESRGWS